MNKSISTGDDPGISSVSKTLQSSSTLESPASRFAARAELFQKACELIAHERVRQYTLHPKTCAEVPDLAVLVEEVGEVAKAILESDGLLPELVQVAAVAIAWIEFLLEKESRA